MESKKQVQWLSKNMINYEMTSFTLYQCMFFHVRAAKVPAFTDVIYSVPI